MPWLKRRRWRRKSVLSRIASAARDDSRTGEPLVLPHAHNCDYICERNRLIPKAESFATSMGGYRDEEQRGGDWSRWFIREMGRLWKQRNGKPDDRHARDNSDDGRLRRHGERGRD